MLRRFIATWLMLSILGYGMAVIADVHHDAAAQSGTHSHLLVDTDTQADHPDQNADSDHCCHGVMHLLGIAQHVDSARASSPNLPGIRYHDQLHSLALTPTFRPPIAA